MLPEKLKYTKDHEWVDASTADVKVGITEFAQSELGEIVFIELPSIGKTVKAGDTLCVVESTKAASDVYAPVSGTVLSVNSELASAPDQINKDPFNSGWMVTLKDVNQSEISALLNSDQYSKLING